MREEVHGSQEEEGRGAILRGILARCCWVCTLPGVKKGGGKGSLSSAGLEESRAGVPGKDSSRSLKGRSVYLRGEVPKVASSFQSGNWFLPQSGSQRMTLRSTRVVQDDG